MVCRSSSEERGEVTESMRMRSERSKPLHNFTLPCLKWGNQRQMRCMKENSNGEQVSGVDRRSHSSRLEESMESRSRGSESEMQTFLKDFEARPRGSKSKIKGSGGGDDGIEAVREKLMFDLKTAADKMKEALLRKEVVAVAGDEMEEKNHGGVEMEETAVAALSTAEARPWNLRTRRAACKAPIADGGGSKTLKIDGKKSNSDPPFRCDGGVKSPKLKIGPEKKKKLKLVVPLSKREIDEDFMEMLGLRPPRRPKKRTRIIQKQLDTLFPGLWLSEVTADLYKVPELPDNGKR